MSVRRSKEELTIREKNAVKRTEMINKEGFPSADFKNEIEADFSTVHGNVKVETPIFRVNEEIVKGLQILLPDTVRSGQDLPVTFNAETNTYAVAAIPQGAQTIRIKVGRDKDGGDPPILSTCRFTAMGSQQTLLTKFYFPKGETSGECLITLWSSDNLGIRIPVIAQNPTTGNFLEISGLSAAYSVTVSLVSALDIYSM